MPCWDHAPYRALASLQVLFSYPPSGRASDGTPLRGYPSHFASLAGPSRSRAAGGYAVRSPSRTGTDVVQRAMEGRMNWVRMALTTYRPASAQAMPV